MSGPDLSWNNEKSGLPLWLKVFIIVVVFGVLIIGSRGDLINTFTSYFSSDTEDSVYTVKVNKNGNYDREIQSIVKQLFPSGKKVSDLEKFQVLHDFVAGYIEYDYAALNARNFLQSANEPKICFPKQKGVCGCYAQMYKDLCEKAGLKCGVVYGRADFLSRERIGHVWNAVYLDGKCYHVDVCRDDTGAKKYEFSLKGNNAINITGAQFRTWDGDFPFEESSYNKSKLKDITLEILVK